MSLSDAQSKALEDYLSSNLILNFIKKAHNTSCTVQDSPLRNRKALTLKHE